MKASRSTQAKDLSAGGGGHLSTHMAPKESGLGLQAPGKDTEETVACGEEQRSMCHRETGTSPSQRQLSQPIQPTLFPLAHTGGWHDFKLVPMRHWEIQVKLYASSLSVGKKMENLNPWSLSWWGSPGVEMQLFTVTRCVYDPLADLIYFTPACLLGDFLPGSHGLGLCL